MMKQISETAPERFKERSRLIMDTNMSWFFGGSVSYFWFGYFMIRFAWRIPKEEIEKWKKDVWDIYTPYSWLFYSMTLFFNLMSIGLSSWIVLYAWFY